MVSRLDSIQAAILRVKLTRLRAVTAGRRKNAAMYRKAMAGCPAVICPQDPGNSLHVYHTFVIRTPRRDELQQELRSHGIGTAIHYPIPIHLMHAGRNLGFHPGMFPNTERFASEILSLPIYPELEESSIEEIAERICRFHS